MCSRQREQHVQRLGGKRARHHERSENTGVAQRTKPFANSHRVSVKTQILDLLIDINL